MQVVKFEFGGGLGDVISQCYWNGYYCHLERAGMAYGRAQVNLVTHNPYVPELFRWHPRKDLIDVVECGYWLPEKNKEMRPKWGLDPRHQLPRLEEKPIWYYSPEDSLWVETCKLAVKPFVVISQAAGLPARNVPVGMVLDVMEALKLRDIVSVLVGRTFERHGRAEDLLLQADGSHTINLIDKLSVPGTLRILEMSQGLVTCHSALNLAGWHMRKPQLLLYPQSVKERHFLRRDQWAFGADFPETSHACWDDPGAVAPATRKFIERFKP